MSPLSSAAPLSPPSSSSTLSLFPSLPPPLSFAPQNCFHLVTFSSNLISAQFGR